MQEFSKTEERKLGALARPDDFLMNLLIQGHSSTALHTSRHALSTRRETNGDDSGNDPHAKAGIFQNQMTQNSGSEDSHDMVTGVHEEVTYFSSSICSGKQKKNHSTSQPHIHSENTPATIEADQIFLALQQLANNNNSANFHYNISRYSKFPKSLTTTMPMLDAKSEKFELFEDNFQTSLKVHKQLTEEDGTKDFHSLMKQDALKTFKINNGPTRENLGETLAVF